MHRRVLVILLFLAALTTAALAAFVGFGPPRVTLSDDAGTADQVTLYQNGLAFVELSRSFQAPNGTAELAFQVPASTVFGSVRIEGGDVAVTELRSTLSEHSVVRAGDEVLAHVGDQVFSGTVISQTDGELLLSTEEGTTVVSTDRIDALEIRGRTLEQPSAGSALVTALVEAEPGRQTVRITYLARGAGWTPHHELDTRTGAWTMHARLTGLHDWENVTLELVSGSPHVVTTSPFPTQEDEAAREGGALGDDGGGAPSFDVGFGSSEQLGELNRYTLDREITLHRGQSVRLPVLTGEVELLGHTHDISTSTGFGAARGEETSIQVFERYEIHNTLDEPLPPGVVSLYRDGTWIGEDVLEPTPREDRTNITAAFSEDVDASLVLESFNSTELQDTRTYALHVENFKPSFAEDAGRVDLRASLSYPSDRTSLTDTDPEPTRVVGTTVTWERSLNPGEALTFRITYTQQTGR